MRLLAAFALGLVARMGMGMFRWAFELLYPEIAQSNGSLQDAAEKDVVLVSGCRRWVCRGWTKGP